MLDAACMLDTVCSSNQHSALHLLSHQDKLHSTAVICMSEHSP
jgi:hypothetical protein